MRLCAVYLSTIHTREAAWFPGSDPAVSLSLRIGAALKSDHQLNWESSSAFDWIGSIEI